MLFVPVVYGFTRFSKLYRCFTEDPAVRPAARRRVTSIIVLYFLNFMEKGRQKPCIPELTFTDLRVRRTSIPPDAKLRSQNRDGRAPGPAMRP